MVKGGIPGVNVEVRGLSQFMGSCNNNELVSPNFPDKTGADLLVSPAKNESLCTDRTEDDPGIHRLFGKRKKGLFITVCCNKSLVPDSINAEQGLFNGEPAGNGISCCTGTDDIKRSRQHYLINKLCYCNFCPLFILFFIHLFCGLYFSRKDRGPGNAIEVGLQRAGPVCVLINIHYLCIPEIIPVEC